MTAQEPAREQDDTDSREPDEGEQPVTQPRRRVRRRTRRGVPVTRDNSQS
jgi:hypothetical protein